MRDVVNIYIREVTDKLLRDRVFGTVDLFGGDGGKLIAFRSADGYDRGVVDDDRVLVSLSQLLAALSLKFVFGGGLCGKFLFA